MGILPLTFLIETHTEMSYKLFCLAFISINCFIETQGHGFMYYPPNWNARTETTEANGPEDGNFGLSYPVPKVHCGEEQESQGLPCAHNALVRGGAADWFTNNTLISTPTLPSDMYDEGKLPGKQRQKHPWASPGSSHAFGEGCGVNGGNPNGCEGQGDVPYGTCCPGPPKGGCGGYPGGYSAMKHASEGLFDNAFVTQWNRGESAAVYWASGARHRGGYSYRLCKVPAGGIAKVTEKCFQDGHLDFVGDKTWIQDLKDTDFNPENWKSQDAVRTMTVTNPHGSEWTKIVLPRKPKNGDHYAFKDLVAVPENLELGEYLLSWRWDTERVAQVWASCAKIQIV